MYAFIKGILAVKTPTYVVIDNNGIGYHINVSVNTYSALKNAEKAFLHTVLIVKEDAHILYGFAAEQEKDVFTKLISVSGVGPTTAIVMLSNMTADEIQKMIIQGNTIALTKIKGIGAKTAQRLILELKDKMQKTSWAAIPDVSQPINIIKDAGAEAIAALVMLGYSKNLAETAIQKISVQTDGLTVEQMIRQALKNL